MVKIHKRYGKNITEVKYDFKKAYPEKTILKISVDKSYRSTKKDRWLKKRYLVRVKDQ